MLISGNGHWSSIFVIDQLRCWLSAHRQTIEIIELRIETLGYIVFLNSSPLKHYIKIIFAIAPYAIWRNDEAPVAKRLFVTIESCLGASSTTHHTVLWLRGGLILWYYTYPSLAMIVVVQEQPEIRFAWLISLGFNLSRCKPLSNLTRF